MLSTVLCVSACSYQSAGPWRRSVCHEVPPGSEREACLEEASRSEKEYQQDIEASSQPSDR